MSDPQAIPNLWPTDRINLATATPRLILQAQAQRLEQMTQGLLSGRIQTVEGEGGMIETTFEVLAGRIDRSHLLLSVRHEEEMVYPARLYDPFEGEGRYLRTQAEFVEGVKRTLHSQEVISVIESLIAMSLEASVAQSTGASGA
jgi:hypothetical protein